MAICREQQINWDVCARWLSDRTPLSQAGIVLAAECQVGVQIYTQFTGSTYSSNACKELDCATFLHVPHTHLIFLLASFTTTTTTGTINIASKTIDTATLCDNLARLLLMPQMKQQDIGAAVTSLEKLCRQKSLYEEAATSKDASVDPDDPTRGAAWVGAINANRILQEEDGSSEYEDFDPAEGADEY
jgi:hypothetical protein